MEKYIGKDIKINLEKGLDFNYQGFTVKIYQIYKDNGTTGGMVSEGVTIEEESWIKGGGMVVNMIGGGKVHVSGKSIIKGVVTLFADEVYLDSVFMKDRACRIVSADGEDRVLGKVRIKNLTMYEGSEIKLFVDSDKPKADKFEIDIDRVKLGEKAILNLQNYGSVRNLDMYYSSVINARVSSKFSINNTSIGEDRYISFSSIGTLFVSDFTVKKSVDKLESNHITFANQNGESDLIISNCLVDNCSLSKKLVDECEIYERVVKWESQNM
jgi:hypothetical protein